MSALSWFMVALTVIGLYLALLLIGYTAGMTTTGGFIGACMAGALLEWAQRLDHRQRRERGERR